MIRIGIIGCGDIVNLYQRFSSHVLQSKGLQVTALVDSNIKNAQRFLKDFSSARAVTALDSELLSSVDAFLIAAPNHLHHHYGKVCLEAGKHVLMEKPLATTLAQCTELIALSQRYHCILMVALCMRFHPLLQQFKHLLDEQAVGEVFQLSIWTEQHTEFPPSHWYTQEAMLGGGQLFSHGCHYIDLLMWLMGEPIAGFFLGTNKGTSWMEGEGTSNVCLKFKNQALGYYFGTWGARGTRNDYLIQAHGTQGMLEANFTQSSLTMYSKGDTQDIKQFYTGYTKEKVLFDEPIDMRDMYQHEMVHFLECIQKKSVPLTDAATALESMRIIWQLYQQGSFGLEKAVVPICM